MSTVAIAQSTYPAIGQKSARFSWKRAGIWAIQGVVVLLFLFAGTAKLLIPADALAQQAGLPGAFLKFIGVCEIAGALGLVLPGRFGINRNLTPLAAAGLVVIMAGAVMLTVATQGIAPAVFPLVVGCLLIVVIRARWERRIARG